MTRVTRRDLLCAAGAAALAAATSTAPAIDPLPRVNPRIKGLSLSAYSLRSQMRWFSGKESATGKLDTLGFLDYCAQLGVEGAELTSYFFQTPVERAYANDVKRRAHLLGLDVTSAAMGNDFSHPPDGDTARQELEYVRTWIDHFADMGAPSIRIFATRRPPKGATEDQIIANIVANLAPALAHAERRGVMLGLENHDFTSNVDRLLKILKAIDSRWLGVTWDSGNLPATPDPYAELARIAPYALVAQVKAMIPVNGKKEPADFARLAKVLRDAQYAGYLVLEYEEAEDPYKAIPRHVAALRAAIGAR